MRTNPGDKCAKIGVPKLVDGPLFSRGHQDRQMRIRDVQIQPRIAALLELGASEADFAAALEAALDLLGTKVRDELPAPTQIPLIIAGHKHPLGKIAIIRVRIG